MPPKIREIYADLGGQVMAGKLSAPVDTVYPIENIRDALAHADKGGRNGKISGQPQWGDLNDGGQAMSSDVAASREGAAGLFRRPLRRRHQEARARRSIRPRIFTVPRPATARPRTCRAPTGSRWSKAGTSAKANGSERARPHRVDRFLRPGHGVRQGRVRQMPPRYFTDYLTLLKVDGRWQVISKTFHTVTKES